MSEQLRECPFCGGKPRVFELFGDKYMSDSVGFDVECKCGAYMNAESPTRQGAIDKWNRRPPSIRFAAPVDVESARHALQLLEDARIYNHTKEEIAKAATTIRAALSDSTGEG